MNEYEFSIIDALGMEISGNLDCETGESGVLWLEFKQKDNFYMVISIDSDTAKKVAKKMLHIIDASEAETRKAMEGYQ